MLTRDFSVQDNESVLKYTASKLKGKKRYQETFQIYGIETADCQE